MLVLSRKLNENILIGDQIVVKVLKLGLDSIRLGIEAPPDVPVHRQEIYDEIRRNNENAVTAPELTLPRVKQKIRRPEWAGPSKTGSAAPSEAAAAPNNS